MANVHENGSVRKIAALAGVSPAIVSAVLSGKDRKGLGIRFSEETARKVKEIAEGMEYVPNRLAKALIGKEAFAIGVLSTHEKHERYDSIIRNLSARCLEKGYHLILTPCGYSHEGQLEKIRSLMSLQVNVIAMIPPGSKNTGTDVVMAEHREQLALCPDLVCVDWMREELVFDCVTPDGDLLLELPLRHLRDNGHRTIALIGPCPPRRRTLLIEKLKTLGLEDTTETALTGFIPVNITEDDVPELVRSVLNRTPRPTALFCWRDSFAAVAYRVCEREYGLKVGRDVALIGMDDTLLARCLPVPLTSMDLRNAEIADRLFELIEDKIAGRTGAKPVQRIVKPELVIRESSDFTVRQGG